jgi:predicted HicB family RNase H-like nuclease
MEEIIQFRASTMRMIETKFANALESYFVFCRERGIEPKKPAGPAF